MFTGLIEEVGQVHQNNAGPGKLSIRAKTVLEDIKIGNSIAVDGVCLTVTSVDEHTFSVDVTPETRSRSVLGHLRSGDAVNLERPMIANGRFGGHFVSGHVDGIGRIAFRVAEENSIRMGIEASEELCALIVEKGSVAIDGVSITVAKVDGCQFAVSVIPHTAVQTTLNDKRVGDSVNLETDIIGKYVQKLLRRDSKISNITLDFLRQHGF